MRWNHLPPLALMMTLGLALGWPAAGQGAEAAAGTEAAEGAEAAEAAKDSAIFDVPLDGTSKETFNAGVERVKAEATPAEYNRLQQAMGLIQNYDLAMRSNPSLFYTRMDGKTPREVIKIAEDRYGL